MYMKKLSKNEVIAIVVALVVITSFVVFGSMGLFSSSSSLSLNNLNMNISDNGSQQAPQLLISDLVVGTGTEAVAGKHIVVNYKGTLIDGTEFDSSYSRGVPFDFDLGAGQVIAGWEQGFSGMKVGGKRKLVIPANLGYGERAIGPIPANSTLIFEVELLDVK
jgi:FKBP-type peptidyl-prolyl cis-trans isomerase